MAVSDGFKAIKAASEKGQKIFGMMVTDGGQHLVGMISRNGILLFMRPKHVHILIKKHIRRIAVVENGAIAGII